MYCVYKHTVPNGKVYIGITSVNPLQRWCNGHGYKDNKAFWKDIVLYGWLNIKHEILYSNLTEEEARNAEARLICEYQSYKRKYGYNREVGYCYGYIEKETRYNMSRDEYIIYCQTDEYRGKCIPKKTQRKPVYQYDLHGNGVAVYPSIGEAARRLKVDKKCIRDCFNGKQKTCKGFVFRPAPVED